MADVFSWIALVLLATLIAFQLILAGGAPLGHLAWGGQHRRLPGHFRAASFVTALFLMVCFAALLRAAGLGAGVLPMPVARAFLWTLTVVMMFSIVGNAATSSIPERIFGLPMTIGLTISLLGVLLWS